MFLESSEEISAREYWQDRLKFVNEEHAREIKTLQLTIRELARLIVTNAIQNGSCIYCKQSNISHKITCPTFQAFINYVN